MKTLQIRNMPEDLHRDLTRQAAEKGISLNSLLLGYLQDTARMNRHLTAQRQQATDRNTEVLRRSRHRQEPSPSRQDIVDTIRDLRDVR